MKYLQRLLVWVGLFGSFGVFGQQKKEILAIAGHYTDTSCLFWVSAPPRKELSAAQITDILNQKHGKWLGKISSLEIQDSFKNRQANIWHVVAYRQKPADAPEKEFSFLTGSCLFQYPFPFLWKRRYRNHIFKSMQEKPADFMLWLGDNVYLTLGEWNSPKKMLKKHLGVRHTKHIKEFFELMPNYATWDDHDFGANNCDGTVPYKLLPLENFEMMWRNPYYGETPAKNDGINTHFRQGESEFFLLDNRYFSNDSKKEMYGDAQLKWLEIKLKESTATYKFIVSGAQFLTLDKQGVHLNQYPKEREQIIDIITKNKITGVLFISGDRHFAEVIEWKRPNDYPLIEITTSPLTSFIDESGSVNGNRVPNTMITKPNYAKFTLKGKGEDQKWLVELFDRNNKLYWTYEIWLKNLK